MRVIFGKNRLPFSAVIRVFTWSRWSHVGVISECGKYVYEAKAPQGVVLTPIDKFKSRYRECKQAELPCNVDYQWLKSQLGKRYDWWAVIGIGLRRRWDKPDRWFCAELVAGACDLWRHDYHGRISPQDNWIISKDLDDED